MKRSASQPRQAAEMLAIGALAFIAEQPDQLAAFLAATGLTAEGIRAAAQEPGFFAGVLEHMLSDEKLLVTFADSAGIDPGEVARACDALGRGQRTVPWA